MNSSFKDFATENRWMLTITLAFPIILITCYITIILDCEINTEVWNTILTCFLTYYGTIGWGLFIYHDSWLRSKEEDYRNRPRLSIGYHYDRIVKKNSGGHQCFFSYQRIKDMFKGDLCKIRIFEDKDISDMEESQYGFLGIEFKNYGSHLIYLKAFTSVYVVNREMDENIEIMKQEGTFLLSLKNNPYTLAFNDTTMYLLGIEKELVDTTKSIRRDICITLSIEDEFSKEHYYFLPIYYNNGSIMFGCRKEMNIKEFNKIYHNPNLILKHLVH